MRDFQCTKPNWRTGESNCRKISVALPSSLTRNLLRSTLNRRKLRLQISKNRWSKNQFGRSKYTRSLNSQHSPLHQNYIGNYSILQQIHRDQLYYYIHNPSHKQHISWDLQPNTHGSLRSHIRVDKSSAVILRQQYPNYCLYHRLRAMIVFLHLKQTDPGCPRRNYRLNPLCQAK